MIKNKIKEGLLQKGVDCDKKNLTKSYTLGLICTKETYFKEPSPRFFPHFSLFTAYFAQPNCSFITAMTPAVTRTRTRLITQTLAVTLALTLTLTITVTDMLEVKIHIIIVACFTPTHLLTHPLTRSLIHSLTHSLTHIKWPYCPIHARIHVVLRPTAAGSLVRWLNC